MGEQDEVAKAAMVFGALAHPRRVEIIRALRLWPSTASGLARSLDCSWTTASKHLAVLERAGLVEWCDPEYGSGWVYTLTQNAVQRVARCVDVLER